jgi:hypothetical protein
VVDLPADAPALGAERVTPYRSITVPLKPGDAFLSIASAAQGALARGKAVVGEMVNAEARDVARRVAAAVPGDDPATGDVFENTVLLLKCIDQPAADAGEGRAAGGAGMGLGLQNLGGSPLTA